MTTVIVQIYQKVLTKNMDDFPNTKNFDSLYTQSWIKIFK